MSPDEFIAERPVAATAVVAAVTTLAYLGIQLALDGAIAPVETATFAVVFTLVYVVNKRFVCNRLFGVCGIGSDPEE